MHHTRDLIIHVTYTLIIGDHRVPVDGLVTVWGRSLKSSDKAEVTNCTQSQQIGYQVYHCSSKHVYKPNTQSTGLKIRSFIHWEPTLYTNYIPYFQKQATQTNVASREWFNMSRNTNLTAQLRPFSMYKHSQVTTLHGVFVTSANNWINSCTL